MCFDAVLSPASANALKVPGSMRVLNCHLPTSEKARIVRERKWDNLLVDLEHDMRAVGRVQRTWMDSFGSLWGRIELSDERGEQYVRSILRRTGRMPEISLTVCYSGDGLAALPSNTAFSPMTASAFNELLRSMGGAVIGKYEARAVSLVENGDVPCSTASAITFASADGTGAAPKLGEIYVINRGAHVDKVMSTAEKKETTPAKPPAEPAADAKPPVEIADDDVPTYSNKQMVSVLLDGIKKRDELMARTAALPAAINVLNNYDLNERQKKRLSDFVADPTKSPDFAKVQMFLEDFIEPADAEKDDKEESEPEAKKRKLNEATRSIKTPAPDANKKKDKDAPKPVAVAPGVKQLMDTLGMSADVLTNNTVISEEHKSILQTMLSGARVEKVEKVKAN